MSTHRNQKRLTPSSIKAMKGQQPLVCLTAYTTGMARLLDPHCDLLLVGDSLGMVLYGMDTTVGVTLDMMIAHGRAVMRGVQRSCVIVDLPFGSYQESKEQAFRNAVQVLQQTGCDGVKLEGGEEMAETIAFLVTRGVPVCAHVGLMPQQVHAVGYRSVGHSEEEVASISRDAAAVCSAGAFAIVIEGTVETLARDLTKQVEVPSIGIGASVACDGQILVADDMIGMFNDFTPRFVKRYADVAAIVSEAAGAYAKEVRERSFPSTEHTFVARSTR